jgi:predicted RNA-binding protein with PUA domain
MQLTRVAFRIDRDLLTLVFVREGLDEQTALIALGRIAKVHKIPGGPSLFK